MQNGTKEKIYQVIGIGMFCYLFSVINFVDTRFVEYFSCFSFAIIALGFLLKLKFKFLNLFTISYLIVSIYLIVLQLIWISENGLNASFTYQNPEITGFPWWIHVIMHGTPIPLVFLVIYDKKTEINWKNFTIIIIILLLWSYIIDGERFIGIPLFWIAYPIGIPLSIFYLLIYTKLVRPKLIINKHSQSEKN
jgi:hypothetical protein